MTALGGEILPEVVAHSGSGGEVASLSGADLHRHVTNPGRDGKADFLHESVIGRLAWP